GEGDGEVREEKESGTPAGSEHEDDNSDDASLRRRAEAMEALTKIEIEFARLRDKLFIERMVDVEKERVGVETGGFFPRLCTHPELLHLTRLIELRKERKLDLAKRWLNGLEAAYERRRESEEHTVWSCWANDGAELRSNMMEDARSKKRKLDREKRNMDHPKDGGLSPYLAPRQLPVVPLQHRRRVGFEGDVLTENDIAWALRHPDLRTDPSVSALDDDSTWSDLERMGLREPIRHFGYDPSGYGPGMMHNPAAFGAPPPALAVPFGYATAFDTGALPMPPQQHHFGPALGSGQQQLPPLPPPTQQTSRQLDFQAREQLNPSRPLSNPRATTVQQQSGGGHTRSLSNQGMRAYPGHFGGPTYPDHEVADRVPSWQKQQQQHGGPSHTTGGLYQFEERRPANAVSSGTSGTGLAESLDIVAEHHPRRSLEEAGVKASEAANGKAARFTLDEHMSHQRSPKPNAPVQKVGGDAPGARIAPAFVIPPFNPQNHQAATQAPQPPTLPLPPTATATTNTANPPTLPKSVFPQAGGGPGGAAHHFGHPSVPARVERASG
ncbi:hypothetical protein P7C70_g6793, partial [Phenoliferia sp. Uapishka_3]